MRHISSHKCESNQLIHGYASLRLPTVYDWIDQSLKGMFFRFKICLFNSPNPKQLLYGKLVLGQRVVMFLKLLSLNKNRQYLTIVMDDERYRDVLATLQLLCSFFDIGKHLLPDSQRAYLLSQE